MIKIESIEIKYFRSIYTTRFRDLKDISILSGKNDVGKSNILKALNLFFNNETDWKTPFDFSRDFSKKRLAEVRKETIRGRQFIQITVEFIRGKQYEKSLPEKFTVRRTWHRDSGLPATTSSVEKDFRLGNVPSKNLDRAEASLKKFLNRTKFEYIPAIKDRDFFGYMLGNLQDIILEKRSGESSLGVAIQELNAMVEREARELQKEFLDVTGVSAGIKIPEKLDKLFRAFDVSTLNGEDRMSLDVRGDGIRSRFIPSLLHYISSNARLNYVWGFEEPENSLEHGLATKLAGEIFREYGDDSQIFLTTHSPAFFNLKRPNTCIYRIFIENGSAVAEKIHPTKKAPKELHSALEIDLGLMEIQAEYQARYEDRMKEVDIQKENFKKMESEIKKATLPTVLTEGKWDVTILNMAWDKLFPNKERKFNILSSDTTPSDESRSSGGAPALKSCLEGARPDQAIAVGLFDRDLEGLRMYDSLSKNFEKIDEKMRLQREGSAGAILLPVCAGREAYADVLNLVLEFYFEDEYLEKRIEERGLAFIQPQIEHTVLNTGFKLPRTTSSQKELRKIQDNTKKIFAEVVVPQLPKEAFSNFKELFNLIETAISELQKRRKPKSSSAVVAH